MIYWKLKKGFIQTRGFCLGILSAWVLTGSSAMGQIPPRVPNWTSRMPVQPARENFRTTNAFPGMAFTNPVAIKTAPGDTNRLFIVERSGRIVVITNLASPSRKIFMDITDRVDSDYDRTFAEGLASIAFHPGYATNGTFYACYTLITNTEQGSGKHNRISRFETSSTDPNLGLPNSELPLLTQRDEGDGHNWNDLAFGSDGYLYAALGDEGDGGGFDFYNNSQKIDKDFFSAIMRIDVDKKAGNLLPNPHPASTTNYLVPSDNPYIGATSFNGISVNPANVRTEFWAVGIRNPWRMHIDLPTGNIYIGDVGQHSREEINLVVRGGNYGWAFREGDVPGRTNPPAGFNPIPPLLKYQHGYTATNEGKAVIGGVIYRGSRLPELNGAYIFTDYVTGNIWSLRHSSNTMTEWRWLSAQAGIAGFGPDPRNGDLLMADNAEGIIFRLEAGNTNGSTLPPTLEDTRLFADLPNLVPQEGVVGYDLNFPFWSDNATKQRWFSIPISAKINFARDTHWTFPAGSFWIKHFELQLTNGQPPRRLETRVLVKNNNGVYGATYRWGTSTTNATLVSEGGMDENLVINQGGIIRTQVWRYPSQNECLSCHTPGAGYVLGFNTHQLNRPRTYGNIITNQLAALEHMGYFQSPIGSVHTLRALHPFSDNSVSVEQRVRSYLAANCAQCHHPGGTGRGTFDTRFITPLSVSGMINGALVNNGGNTNNRVVKPNSPSESMLLTRIANLGTLHMPPLGTTVLDTEAIAFVQNWITNDLSRYQSYPDWAASQGLAGANAGPQADPDNDGAKNQLEYLLGRNPNNGGDGWRIDIQRDRGTNLITFVHIANRGFEVEYTTNLFSPAAWKTLDVPSNRSFISSKDHNNVVEDPTPSQTRYYRVRVYEP